MKKRLLIFLMLAASLWCNAQTFSEAETESDIRARASVNFEKKIAKGLHIEAGEEIRFKGNLSQFDRSYTSAGLEWKVCKWLKAAGDYTFMYVNRPDDNDCSREIRHRAAVNFTGLYKLGYWHFSLRERLQSTWYTREGFNTFQSPDPALALRSRLKTSCSLPGKPLEPYLSCELRNTLNAVDWHSLSTTNASSSVSYNDIYLNRTRLSAGVEWHLNTRNVLDICLIYDRVKNTDIDATKKGKLKSVTGERFNDFSLGLSYTFGR